MIVASMDCTYGPKIRLGEKRTSAWAAYQVRPFGAPQRLHSGPHTDDRSGSVHVASISSLRAELLQNICANDLQQRCMYTGRHALQASTHVNGGASCNPFANRGFPLKETMLYVVFVCVVP